jgi:DNA polymerase-4
MASRISNTEPDKRINPAPPLVLHLDLNSAFASMEQQANPLLRGVPVAVAAYTKPYGCILAASREAKLWGVKTGMTVEDGRHRCPFLVVLKDDPNKYRHLHRQIKEVLEPYSDRLLPKSIDEFVLNLSHTPSEPDPVGAGLEIQRAIKERVGEWLTVSVGLGPNRFLAKLGSNLKHDRPFSISHRNLTEVYRQLALPDLPGINWRYSRRLKEQGVHSPLEFLEADSLTLKAAFRSVLARDWYLRLRGWEVDDWGPARRTFGQSYVLPRPLERERWLPVLAKLVDKAVRRLRAGGYGARGAYLSLYYGERTRYHRGHTQPELLSQTSDLFKLASSLIPRHTPSVKKIAVTFFDLLPLTPYQCSLLVDTPARLRLTRAVDRVNDRFGPYTLHLASMLNTDRYVRDAISFGN